MKHVFMAVATSAMLWMPVGAASAQLAEARNVQAQAIVEEMLNRQAASRAGVDGYLTIEGQSTGSVALVYYEKLDNELGFRIVMPDELIGKASDNLGIDLSDAVYGMEITAALGMKVAGNIARILGETTDKIETTRALALDRPTKADDILLARQSLEDTHKFAAMATIVDRQTYLGKDAFIVGGIDLNEKQITEEGEFTINAMALWIDANTYDLLGMNVYGTALTPDFTTPQPFEIHRTNEEFVTVGNSSLRLPRKVGMGVRFDFLSQEEEKEKERAKREFEKAKAEYDKFQEQMKNASPMEKQMMEQMMKAAGVDIEAMMQQAEFLYEGEPIAIYSYMAVADMADVDDYFVRLQELESGGEAATRADEAVEQAKRAAEGGWPEDSVGGRDPILKSGKF